MIESSASTARKFGGPRVWIRVGFLLWALFAMSWLLNSVRTQGVDEATLRSSHEVTVQNDATVLSFLPARPSGPAALVFFCGSGIAAEAYAPLLRPVAARGVPVFVVRLPYRFAPREADREAAVARARAVMAAHPELKQWVIAGHSLGAALAARMAQPDRGAALAALILVATTHPKDEDLSSLRLPVTKVYGTRDGVAPAERVLANRRLLPPHTRWVEIAGGNHAQFGRYGHQLFDGAASISRDEQEALTRAAILQVLAELPALATSARQGD